MLFRYQELSSDPLHPHEKPGKAVCAPDTPALSGMETEVPGLVGQPVGRSRAGQKGATNQVLGEITSHGSVESDRPKPLWPPYTCPCTYVCAHITHTHIYYHQPPHKDKMLTTVAMSVQLQGIGDFCSLVFKVGVY